MPVLGGQYLKSVRPRLVGLRGLVVRSILQQWVVLVLFVVFGVSATGGLLVWLLVGGVSLVAAVGVIGFRSALVNRVPSESEPGEVFAGFVAVLTALASAPAWAGFAAAVLGGGVWNLGVGMAASHVLLLFAVPSPSLVSRFQARLAELGVDVDLDKTIRSYPQ